MNEADKKLITEDLMERKADLMTLQSVEEIKDGLATPIDDLLQMIDKDRNIAEEMFRGILLSRKNGE